MNQSGWFLLAILTLLGGLAAIDFAWNQGRTRHVEFFPATGLKAGSPTPLDLTVEPVQGGAATSLRQALARSPRGVILNFWATWCAPCLEELPSLQLLAAELGKHPGRYPQVFAISVDENVKPVRDLLKQLPYPLTFPIALDRTGRVARAFGTSKFPETVWIDKDGLVRQKWIGPQNWVKREILELVSGKPF